MLSRAFRATDGAREITKNNCWLTGVESQTPICLRGPRRLGQESSANKPRAEFKSRPGEFGKPGHD